MTARRWYYMLATAGFFGAGMMFGRHEWLVCVICLFVGVVAAREARS